MVKNQQRYQMEMFMFIVQKDQQVELEWLQGHLTAAAAAGGKTMIYH